MLEYQKPKHYFGGCLPPPPCPALQKTLRLRLEHTLDQLLIIEQPIGRSHPGFPEIVHLLGQNSGPQRRLMVTRANHRNRRRMECFGRYSPDSKPKTLIRTRQFCAGK
jgi:hypothetical protein